MLPLFQPTPRRALLALGLLTTMTISNAFGAPPRPITVESLLGRMADPSWLAEPPRAGERSFQFSSYDRASKLEGDKIVAPFANGDRGHYLRVEGLGDKQEWVLADAKGPGYVSRIWSANPDGELRIYIDGAAEPVLAADFATITDGKVEPFSAPFGHDASRGRNLYFPFPFAKSIKITTTKGDQYYQVNVTTFAPDTAVESYTPQVLSRAGEAIARARRELTAAPSPLKKSSLSETTFSGRKFSLELPTDAKGRPGALTAIEFKIDKEGLDEAALADALARTLLTITFDDAPAPQVAVPLGDFFGTGPGLNPFRTALTEAREDGTLLARWYMPYRRGVKLSIENYTTHRPQMSLNLNAIEDPAAADKLTFHARWRQRDDVPTIKGDGTLDWPALRVSGGAGRYVGLAANVYNPTPAWWGEGDEKVYVDGEKFPSTFGTGTEDYFGYAWCDPHPFMNPFHAQSRCDGPGNKGNTSNLRLQILDNIPFAESLSFDIELWHWEAVKVQYATIAYFYAAPGATVEPSSVPDLSTRVVHARPPIKREPGAIEAESLKVRAKTAGDVPNQDMTPFGDAWSGFSQLFWLVRQPDARLDLELPVEKAGSYALWGGFTKASDYGTVQFALDGAPLGKPIDLYATSVVHSGEVPLGVADLEAGPHVLSISIAGKNPRSSSYLVGMDWIKLVPAPAGDFGGQTKAKR
ncbi:glycoside hydrolase family 172 protein [Paludisphaera mucosa]|uniref:DUF2961 domain-containing protein n=1 Tax=Paludisphaera mucosa TaxID=3030827 RepID=A0ABT6FKI2_9BACT|nr:glycoside hydrolase family 172 protein [Paludisphaera mucosa]MDG3007900.1 DUF2961 domain-containing protein [Paludisphaera mucosa]